MRLVSVFATRTAARIVAPIASAAAFVAMLFAPNSAAAQAAQPAATTPPSFNNGYYYQSPDGNFSTGKFEQLEQILPTPNTYRTASGAPGHQYWQQKADYVISAELNDETQSITGSETITYSNNSPDVLNYLWLQMDQNNFAKGSDAFAARTGKLIPPQSQQQGGTSTDAMKALTFEERFDAGFKIKSIKDASGKALKYTVVQTMMRVDLPAPLRPGQKYSFSVEWNFNIVNNELRPRSAHEFFPKDGNYIYEIAQWFPRMAVYCDNQGWQHKQFLGQGEFTLPFGDYKVSLTVPADHVLGATGVLQNPSAVLSAEQMSRLKRAETADAPVMVVTVDEARKSETRTERSKQKKTWIFEAENVRDFAWASSRKFAWDALGVVIPETGKRVMAMSYYPKEASPLWDVYSTRSVAHTLRVYSKFTVPYPYPVAISVNGPQGGMEYPMICYNGPRPEADGTYSARVKYALISVVIHEVGHNFFPMIINSDERQWSWMDEGLNSFVQYLAEQEWDRNYPSRRGAPRNMVDYMKSDRTFQNPIMTNSEQVLQLGNNAYGKPATALNILRETVLGRDLFDFAFREYSRRWAFKHPAPADLFRTMEDASGVDLDWFWRGWFYTTEACDIALEKVTHYTIDTQNPDVEAAKRKALEAEKPQDLSVLRNKKDVPQTYIERDTAAKDFYDRFDEFAPQPWDKEAFERYMTSLAPDEKALVNSGKHFYELDFRNIGGLVMPIVLQLSYQDGTKEIRRYPAEIWRQNNSRATKVVMASKPVASFMVDPYMETADVDMSNNSSALDAPPTRFQMFKRQTGGGENIMQLQREYQEKEKASKGTK
jgi:hypothetical protein